MKIKWRLGLVEQAQFELYTVVLARLSMRDPYKQRDLEMCLCIHHMCAGEQVEALRYPPHAMLKLCYHFNSLSKDFCTQSLKPHFSCAHNMCTR